MITRAVDSITDPLPKDRPASRKIRISLPVQAALLFFATAALYWSTATQANTFDAISYANQIGWVAETGHKRALFHPHHLLFNAVGYAFWMVSRRLWYHGGPLVVLQRINAVVGAAGVALFFVTLRRLVARRLAWTATALLVFSFGWWICATDGRVNMISSVLLLASFSILLRVLRRPTGRGAALCGVVSGLAVLFHESAGLFLVVGLTGMALAAPKDRVQRLLAYGGAWLAMVAVPYLLIGSLLLHLHSVAAFRHWSNSYVEQGQWWNFHIIHNLHLDLYALRHAVFVDALGRAALRQAAPALARSQGLLTLTLGAFALLYAVALLGSLAALAGVMAGWRSLWQSRHKPIVALCLLWIGITGAFFTFWCPGYFVFWTPVLVPLLTLLALALRTYRRRPFFPLLLKGTAVWVFVCTVMNAACGIGPYLRSGQTLWQRMALDAQAHTSSHALLIVPGAGADATTEVAISYFGNRACLSVHEVLHAEQQGTTPTMQPQITRALLAGRQVYVYGEIWADPGTVEALIAHQKGLTQQEIVTLFAPFRLYPAWISPRGMVYRIRLPRQPIQTHNTPM